MHPAVRLVFVLHDHQPVGNFHDVIEGAYQKSYLPFLDLLQQHPTIRIALHTSGPLSEWLEMNHPEYLNRLASLAAARQIEIVGGGFSEPILAMLPPRDRIGQVRQYNQWLEQRLQTTVKGMWVAERVWDSSMVADLAIAGVEWTILDDFHFKAAGLTDEVLDRYWITESDGHTLSIFPGSEHLRYVIPFAAPDATIEHLRFLASRRQGAVAVFGDDGEKFGVWPETHKTCFQDGWLQHFFRLLEENQEWITMTLPSEVIQSDSPGGKIWLPECSYREMTEWALPPAQQIACINARHNAKSDPQQALIVPFIRGGSWKNFRSKYPEANEMYARMMVISNRLERMPRDSITDKIAYDEAIDSLYRGQCNCAYWHGAFGGIYLPHLRNAIYQAFITAENALDRAEGRPSTWVEAISSDFDFDSKTEVRLSNEHFDLWIAPSTGGMVYEFDLRGQRHNILATLDRRLEAYHDQVRAGPGKARSIIDSSQQTTFKHKGLSEKLRYDNTRRKSLVDHFFDVDASSAAIVSGEAMERGDFATGAYEASIRRNPDRMQVLLSRAGNVWGIPFTLSKAITLSAGSDTVEIGYKLEDLPDDFCQHLAVEFNFAGLPAQAKGRCFKDNDGLDLGHLGTHLDLKETSLVSLEDDWLDIRVSLNCGVASNGGHAGFWTFPIESVSQSEGGFELIHQSVVVMPHWIVTPDANGCWDVLIRVSVADHINTP
ncbi:MAG: DUF1926 domain-containing protein [Planctomycetaceae bacterium]|jgi:alpha-amylase|nr:DUF1926 domain-containing protein [Planctomycetaceae bacterium]